MGPEAIDVETTEVEETPPAPTGLAAQSWWKEWLESADTKDYDKYLGTGHPMVFEGASGNTRIRIECSGRYDTDAWDFETECSGYFVYADRYEADPVTGADAVVLFERNRTRMLRRGPGKDPLQHNYTVEDLAPMYLPGLGIHPYGTSQGDPRPKWFIPCPGGEFYFHVKPGDRAEWYEAAVASAKWLTRVYNGEVGHYYFTDLEVSITTPLATVNLEFDSSDLDLSSCDESWGQTGEGLAEDIIQGALRAQAWGVNKERRDSDLSTVYVPLTLVRGDGTVIQSNFPIPLGTNKSREDLTAELNKKYPGVVLNGHPEQLGADDESNEQQD